MRTFRVGDRVKTLRNCFSGKDTISLEGEYFTVTRMEGILIFCGEFVFLPKEIELVKRTKFYK